MNPNTAQATHPSNQMMNPQPMMQGNQGEIVQQQQQHQGSTMHPTSNVQYTQVVNQGNVQYVRQASTGAVIPSNQGNE